jgi:hypothetical protein
MRRIKKFSKRLAKYTLIPAFSAGLLYGLADGAVWLINKRMNKESNTVVFSNSQIQKAPEWTFPITNGISNFVMYLPLTLRQNLNSNKVDWYNLPTKEDIYTLLKKERYSNVVFIGHGSKNHFYAKNGYVYAEVVRKKGIKKKDGFLIQHTCGGGIGLDLREALLKNPRKGYSVPGKNGPLENYLVALENLVEENQ